MTKKTQETPVEEKDLLVSFLNDLTRFCKKYKKGLLAALVILIVAAAVEYAYVTHQNKVKEASWSAYYQAQIALLTQGENEGFFKLDAIEKHFPGSNAAQYGQLLKGDVLYNTENYAQAVNVYKPLVNSKNETVRTAATLSLAAALQATKDYAGSIEVLTKFIEQNPSSFALPQAYFTLALSHELAGHKTEAIDAYKYLFGSHPTTYFGIVAKDKLNTLQK